MELKVYRFAELSEEQKKRIPEMNKELAINDTKQFLKTRFVEDVRNFFNFVLDFSDECFNIEIDDNTSVVNIIIDYSSLNENLKKSVEDMALLNIRKAVNRVSSYNPCYIENLFLKVAEQVLNRKHYSYTTFIGFIMEFSSALSLDATTHYVNVKNNPQYVYDYYVGYHSNEFYYGTKYLFSDLEDNLYTEDGLLLNVKAPKK